MKTIYAYLFLIFSVVVLLTGCAGSDNEKKIPDLAESFSNSDKKPFGTFIAYHQLEEMFYRNTIRDEKRNFEDSWKYLEDTGCVYICIAHSLYSTDEDVDGIVKFVQNGNDAFFAAEEFDSNLLRKLQCKFDAPINIPYLISNKPYQTSGLRMKVEKGK